MIVSFILDPAVMDEQYFRDIPGYRDNVHRLFEGLGRNGVLIVDSQGSLEEELRKAIESLPMKFKQRVIGLFTELLKHKRKRIIKTDDQLIQGNLEAVMSSLNARYPVDGLCLSEAALGREADIPANAIAMSKYGDSAAERLRRWYEELPLLDELPMYEVRECFRRAVQYCKWLRFYDPYIGRGNNNRAFFKGLDFILGIWKEHGIFSGHKATIEIITAVDDAISDEGKRAALRRVQQDVIERLRRKYRDWEIVLSVKENYDLHARYLQGQFLILNMERGFDFIIGDDYEQCIKCRGRTACNGCSVTASLKPFPLTIRSVDYPRLDQLRRSRPWEGCAAEKPGS